MNYSLPICRVIFLTKCWSGDWSQLACMPLRFLRSTVNYRLFYAKLVLPKYHNNKSDAEDKMYGPANIWFGELMKR